MKMKALAKLAALSSVAMCLGVPPGFADAEHCRHVGGSVFTNFIDPPTNALGPVSGDLAGAVSVQILAINGNVYHIRKHFVTTSGDTMTVADTDFTTYPTGVSGLAAATEPMTITRHRTFRRRYGKRDLLRSDQRRRRGDVALLGDRLLPKGERAVIRTSDQPSHQCLRQ